jgi:hypothetical protein
MHARVTRFEGPPSDVDKGIKLIKDEIVPSAKKMRGFKHGYWLVDRATGKGIAMTLFDSEASMRASESDAEQSRARATQIGSRIVGVERYEVIVEA